MYLGNKDAKNVKQGAKISYQTHLNFRHLKKKTVFLSKFLLIVSVLTTVGTEWLI